MKELQTKVNITDSSLIANQARQTASLMRQSLDAVRSKSSPQLGVAGSADPDQRGFVTDALKGYTMVQRQVGAATTGVLSVNADYGKVPQTLYNNRQTDFVKDKPMRMLPGQPYVFYPVASGSTSAGLSYLKDGKADYVRTYPSQFLTRNHRSYIHGEGGDFARNVFDQGETIVGHPDVDFLFPDFGLAWGDNSPLPPGLRYVELEDVAAEAFGIFLGSVDFLSLEGKTRDDFGRPPYSGNYNDPYPDSQSNTFLPKDVNGNVRKNILKLPDGAWFYLSQFYSLHDEYWTGEVADPLNWQDTYWDGLDRDPTGKHPRVYRPGMAEWLKAHPKAQLT